MSRPFRYTFILALVALATGLAAVSGWRYARASAPVNGPIILISIDGLRADHLPVYGYDKVRTPAIDALAADAVVFERAYSHAPQTLPAHASLLTGRLPFETGVRDNVGFVVNKSQRLLAEMLRDRGFETAAVVSSYVLRKETGIDQGFSFFDAVMPAATPDASVGELRRSGAESEQIAEHWLDTAGSSRLFLFLHVYEPHAPYLPMPRFAGLTPYDAAIAGADETVGRLIRYLKGHQLYDRSTIILVSDHGEGLGDHGEQEHGLFVYEEALRVPLIIKQAAAEGAGRRVTDIVQHVDLVPTILDLAKAPASGDLSGRSLKPLLDGGRMGRRNIYSESLYGRYHFGWGELTSITNGRYRYIRAPREELYDLERDPAERDNLAATAPAAIIDPLRHDLKTFGSTVPIPAPAAMSSIEREHLEALGYVGHPSDKASSPADTAPPIDPKDKYAVLETYRAAVRLGVARQWAGAIEMLRMALRDDPDMAALWTQLAAYAARAGRDDQAASAYRRVTTIDASDADAYLGAAAAFLRLHRWDDARQQAARVAKSGAPFTAGQQASAHALLAEIALARGDLDAAREEAELAAASDPALPMPDYISARIVYKDGRLADALLLFEKTAAELQRLQGRPIAGLHYYAGDASIRLKRYADAERELLAELKDFPESTRARAALATLYFRTEKMDAAAQALAAMTRMSPTPETYRVAAGLWDTFGDRRKAAATRAEGRRLFDATAHQPAGAALQQ